MKLYTEIQGDIKEVKILIESASGMMLKVEAYDFTGGRIETFRTKGEVFNTKAAAIKYFK